MRSRILASVFLFVAVVGAGTLAARGNTYLSADKQWTIVNFLDPVVVKGEFVMGKVLIVHDSVKMARGEPCTTFYRFDRENGGPQEAIVSFHCTPKQAAAVATTTFKTISSLEPGCKRLVEYQIAGDSEAHGVPLK
jgi:hypothetical protein